MRRRRRQQFDRVQFLSFYFRAGNIIAGEHRKIQSFIWFPFLCVRWLCHHSEYLYSIILYSVLMWCGVVASLGFFFYMWHLSYKFLFCSMSIAWNTTGGRQATVEATSQPSECDDGKNLGFIEAAIYSSNSPHTHTYLPQPLHKYTHTHIQLNLTVSFNKDVVVVVPRCTVWEFIKMFVQITYKLNV